MTYRFGIFGSFGGESGIKLVEEILSRIKEGSLATEVPFILSSRAADEAGNAHRLVDLVSPGTEIITHSARLFMPQMFKADRARWRDLYHREIMNLISDYRFDAILLVGYMFFTSDELCRRYNLLNLHPALPGGPKGSWQEVIWQLIEEEAEAAGAQIHLATSKWDAGPTLSYSTVPIQSREFAPLWEEFREKLREKSFNKIKREEYATSRLVSRIRRAAAALELPLLLETLRLLAHGDFRIDGVGEGARIIAFGDEMKSGYPLPEVSDTASCGIERVPSPVAEIAGSVKRIIIDRPASRHVPGSGRFRFSDCYSVFDWGAMPDRLQEKGKVLALMSAYNFELLEQAGIAGHYRGLVVDNRIVRYEEAAAIPTLPSSQPAAEMAISVMDRPLLHWRDGRYDYRRYLREAGRNYLVPLEVVYRFSVPPGSSLRRRSTPAEVGLDMGEWPQHEIALSKPVVEFFTKFEGSDRFVEDEEALRLSGLSEPLFVRMEEIAIEVGRILAAEAGRRGLSIADGKLEFACCNGRLHLCDVVGTPDENRFQFNGAPVNKEILRRYHLQHDPLWVEEVVRCKSSPGWQMRCVRSPAALPLEFRNLCAEIYRALANRYLDREWFAVRDLEKLPVEIAKLQGEGVA